MIRHDNDESSPTFTSIEALIPENKDTGNFFCVAGSSLAQTYQLIREEGAGSRSAKHLIPQHRRDAVARTLHCDIFL